MKKIDKFKNSVAQKNLDRIYEQIKEQYEKMGMTLGGSNKSGASDISKDESSEDKME